MTTLRTWARGGISSKLHTAFRTGRSEVQLNARSLTFALLFTAPLITSAARGESRPVHWTESSPPARVDACAVYDSVSDRLVLLGGYAGPNVYQRSRLPAWECALDGSGAWKRSALPSFLGRVPGTSVFDPARRELWQFGFEQMGPAARLGLAPGAGWSMVPVVLDSHARPPVGMAFDFARDRIVLLSHRRMPGELDTLSLYVAPVADTLRFERLQIAGVQPADLFSHALGWDRSQAAFILPAGGGAPPSMISRLSLLVTAGEPHWEEASPMPDPTAGSPPPMYATLGMEDPTSRGLFVVGVAYPDGWRDGAELWKLVWEPSPRWLRLPSPPVMGYLGALAFDSRRHRLLLQGGLDFKLGTNGVTQSFDIERNQWTASAPPVAPEPRVRSAVAYDHPRDRLLLFGGYGAVQAAPLADVWARTSRDGVWQRLVVAGVPPTGRTSASLIEDPRRDRMLVVGGWPGAPAPIELWSLSLAEPPTWSQLHPDGVGPDRVDGAVLDDARDRLVIHGAVSQPFQVGEWELTLGATPHWRRLPVASAAPPPQSCGFTIDLARGRVLIFGGYQGSLDQTISYDTVWGFRLDVDSVRWERISDPNETIRREFFNYWNPGGITVDIVRDRLISFGGFGSDFFEGHASEIATALSLSGNPTWQDLDPVEGGPPRSVEAPIVYDPVRDAFLVFGAGGLNSGNSVFELDGGHEGWPEVEARVAGTMQSAVHLEWSAAGGPAQVQVSRRFPDGAWARVGNAIRGGDGVLRFTDAEVEAGVTAEYRLAWPLAGGEIPVGETSLTVGVPVTSGLQLRGNPARASIAMELDLPLAGTVRVQLVDLAGRVVSERQFDVATPGRQPFEFLPESAIRPGLYFVRVTSPAGTATGRITFLR